MSIFIPTPEARSAAEAGYLARLMPCQNRGDLINSLEDLLSYMPPKNASGETLAIPVDLTQSFELHSDQKLVALACRRLVEGNIELMTEKFDSDKVHDLGSMVSTAGTGPFSWSTEVQYLAFSDQVTIGVYTLLLSAFGFLPQIRDFSYHGYKGKHDSFISRASSNFITSGGQPFERSRLEYLESPHYIRLLYVTNLDVADEIQALALKRSVVHQREGRGFWQELTNDAATSEKMARAQKLIVWVFECAFQSNVEFVKLTDRWTTIFFRIDHSTSALHVGPTMLPRYPLGDMTGISVTQATLAITWVAWKDKVRSDAGKMYLPGWSEGTSTKERYNLRTKSKVSYVNERKR